MPLLGSLFMLLVCLQWVRCDIVLTQSGSEVKQPGQSLNLRCTGSGFDMNSYYMEWVRQFPGGGFEWLVQYLKPGDAHNYVNPTVQGRFSPSKDSSSFYLQMNTLQVADTAMYYCARRSGVAAAFDYWGHGTRVTVTSDTTPSVFPAVSCCSAIKEDIGYIGCLVVTQGYPTESITWEASSGPITAGVRIYSPVSSSDKFISYSSLKVPVCDHDIKNYTCKVGSHSKVVTVPECKRQELSQAAMYSSDAGTDKTEILCVIDKHCPKTISVAWFAGDKPLQETSTCSTSKTPKGFYRTHSNIMIKNDAWLNGDKFTCKATVGSEKTSKTISGCSAKQCMCPPP